MTSTAEIVGISDAELLKCFRRNNMLAQFSKIVTPNTLVLKDTLNYPSPRDPNYVVVYAVEASINLADKNMFPYGTELDMTRCFSWYKVPDDAITFTYKSTDKNYVYDALGGIRSY